MSKKWYAATGTRMIGAIGKTQFMMEELPDPHFGGRQVGELISIAIAIDSR